MYEKVYIFMEFVSGFSSVLLLIKVRLSTVMLKQELLLEANTTRCFACQVILSWLEFDLAHLREELLKLHYVGDLMLSYLRYKWAN